MTDCEIICGEATEEVGKFADRYFDCLVTSPPYWALREYDAPPQVFSDGWEGQLGREPYPQMYLEHLWAIFDVIRPKMKETACVFVVMGDTYAGHQPKGLKADVMDRCMCMIPQRFAWGMIERGWCQHNEITWHKSNAMPGSQNNRFTCTTEKVYYFSMSGEPWFDLHAVLKPYSTLRKPRPRPFGKSGNSDRRDTGRIYEANDQGGRNPGDCWMIPTQPRSESHFAPYPSELIRPLIRAGCPPKVCMECGKPWLRIAEIVGQRPRGGGGSKRADTRGVETSRTSIFRAGRDATTPIRATVGWQPSCMCCELCDTMELTGQQRSGIHATQRPTARKRVVSAVEKPKIPRGPQVSGGYIPEAPQRTGNLQEMREGVHGQEGRGVLQSNLLCEVDVGTEGKQSIHAECHRQVCGEGNRGAQNLRTQGYHGGTSGAEITAGGEGSPHQRRQGGQQNSESGSPNNHRASSRTHVEAAQHELTSYSTRPGIILDPFVGSGTTLVVAREECRRAVGIDLSPEYCEIARKRLGRTQPALMSV